MAFEDRCSPQSAPSPPGIPHSPQNTTSAAAMICSSGSASSSPLSQEMSICVSNSQLSPTTTMVQVKQEECSTSSPPTTNQPINFSITKILSENFGKVSKKAEKKNSLFRPYDDITNDVTTKSTSKDHQQRHFEQFVHSRKLSSVQIERESLSPGAAIDFSRSSADHGLLENTKNNLFASFNMASYPKIQEEILNSRKYHQIHHQTELSESAFSKIPPLGNLCKTVSQIGQSMATINPTIKHDLISASPPIIPNGQQHQQHQPHQLSGRDSGMDSSDDAKSETGSTKDDSSSLGEQRMWPAWVYCTRYSDRPSSGPRYRKPKQPKEKSQVEEKRPRTAFSSDQLARLKHEFNDNRYLTERRRQQLSAELGLNEAQIKIWFQNKRAKIKKSTGSKNPLALQLMAQGLYNHSTVPLTKEEEELEMRMNGQL